MAGRITVDMGAPQVQTDIPVNLDGIDWKCSIVQFEKKYAVVVIGAMSDFDIERISADITEQLSCDIVYSAPMEANKLVIRVWSLEGKESECDAAAGAAAAAAGFISGLCCDKAEIKMVGGTVEALREKEEHILISGELELILSSKLI